MFVTEDPKCYGCGAGLGQPHAPDCPAATCWHCGEPWRQCKRNALREEGPPPWAGDLESVFAGQNRYYIGLDLDEFDYLPTYEGGKLVALRANRVGPGPWHVIETSGQARSLVDLTFPMPHLSMQTA